MNPRLTLVGVISAFLCLSGTLLSQIPQSINYQAVLRDADGNVMKNEAASLRFTVHEVLPEGPVIFAEIHDIVTNEVGIVNLLIGEGQRVSGRFDNIEWHQGQLFLQTEVKEEGQVDFVDLGTIQFVSVPFAFYATEAGKAMDMSINELKDVEVPIIANGQTLKWNGSNWVTGIDDDNQTLSLSGNKLSISEGNSIDLPIQVPYEAGSGISVLNNIITNTGDINPFDDVTLNMVANGEITGPYDALFIRDGVITSNKIASEAITFDKIADNSITSDKIADGAINATDLGKMGATGGQTLKWNSTNNRWEPADDNNTDGQILALNGNQLSITGGNSISLPSSPTYNAGSGISIAGSTITNTGDTNPNDDIVQNTQAGGDLSGTFSNLTVKNNTIITQKIADNAVTTAKLADNAVTAGKIVDGSVTSAKILNGTIAAADLSSMGASGGQVLKWNGSQWAPSAESSNWNSNGSNISNSNSGNVGIGLASPSAKLHLMTDGSANGGLRISAPDRDTDGAGILLDANTIDWSIIATNSNYSTGANKLVFRSTTTSNNLMVFNSDGNIGVGTDNPVYKIHVAASENEGKMAAGYFTNANLMNDAQVLHAEYNGLAGNRDISAVYGKANVTAGFGTGGEFEGGNYGIYARAAGINSGKQVVGVYGTASGNAGTRIGVYGYGNASQGANFNYGVYGSTSGNGLANYAGFFLGNVQVSGTLSKAAGTFKIDHPQDPENKYLVHSFVESPDMMNIYNGNVVTDSEGYATVELPSYFESLNIDYRYQLTVIGTFAQAIIKEKVRNNKFIIQTNEPNVEVSWQVTGVRNDPYARENRIVPVVEKTSSEKGLYLHPELYGQPAAKQLGKVEVSQK